MSSPLVEFVRPACVEAVNRAIHRREPDDIHRLLPWGTVCPFCEEDEPLKAIQDKMSELLDGPMGDGVRDRIAALAQRAVETQDAE